MIGPDAVLADKLGGEVTETNGAILESLAESRKEMQIELDALLGQINELTQSLGKIQARAATGASSDRARSRSSNAGIQP